MIQVLIGHRGVGKSSLLVRIKTYFPEMICLDLDDEIAKSKNKSISEIFRELGEVRFRELEQEEFQKISRKFPKSLICLGAGFQLQNLPTTVEVFWVRRKTDALGRIFLNRPRLNPMITPLAEYHERFAARESSYAERALQVYEMPEGLDQLDEIEKEIWSCFFGLTELQAPEASVTLESTDEQSLRKIKNWDVRYFEMRDDSSSFEENLEKWSLLRSSVPASKIMLSFRSQSQSRSFYLRVKSRLHEVTWDWALELGEPIDEPSILSLHELKDGEDILAGLERLTSSAKSKKTHLKAALKIRDWQDLKMGLAWQAEDPEQRSFLPRSEAGKWVWVRQWLKGRQKINFVKQILGSAPDQPSLWEWIKTPDRTQHFAGVLGDPILHSRSPSFHSNAEIPFFQIQISQDEVKTAFLILQSMGLERAAVTSPLKSWAFDQFPERSESVRQLQTANTLTQFDHHWRSENTDATALRKIKDQFSIASSVMVWGGGGTLPVLREVFPQAQFYSVRTGRDRESSAREQTTEIDLLVWAAGPEDPSPVFLKKIARIFDLNYREDSRARELALQTGAAYQSGSQMFQMQAEAQKEIWGRTGIKS